VILKRNTNGGDNSMPSRAPTVVRLALIVVLCAAGPSAAAPRFVRPPIHSVWSRRPFQVTGCKTTGPFSFVGGGQSNVAGGFDSAVGAGTNNQSCGASSGILGGDDNVIQGANGDGTGADSVIAGGLSQSIQAAGAFIGAGEQNSIVGGGADQVIVGGNANTIGATTESDWSIIGGGSANQLTDSTLSLEAASRINYPRLTRSSGAASRIS
jgi:trimeric autotransporter adhesin